MNGLKVQGEGGAEILGVNLVMNSINNLSCRLILARKTNNQT